MANADRSEGRLCDCESDAQNRIRDTVNESIARVADVLLKIGDEIRKLLLLCNGGSAVAIVAYMGTEQGRPVLGVALRSLYLFGIGLAMLAGMLALGWLFTHRQAAGLRSDALELLHSKITPDEFDERRTAVIRTKWPVWLGCVLAVASFGCWVLGAANFVFSVQPAAARIVEDAVWL